MGCGNFHLIDQLRVGAERLRPTPQTAQDGSRDSRLSFTLLDLIVGCSSACLLMRALKVAGYLVPSIVVNLLQPVFDDSACSFLPFLDLDAHLSGDVVLTHGDLE